MSREEIYSFILKFKTRLLSGKKATLVTKSVNGKAEVRLHVELGEVLPHPVHDRRPQCRDGPSRQCRRQRRADACDALKDEFCSEESFVEKALLTKRKLVILLTRYL